MSQSTRSPRKAPKAVIFDLFGTLVFDRFSSRHFEDLMSHLASKMGGSQERMRECWKATFKNRVVGDYPSITDNFSQIAQQEGWTVSSTVLDEMKSYFYEFTFQSMTPGPGALELLTACRQKGLKVGLMSDCSLAVPGVWSRTHFADIFDAVVFSCELKIQKPNPSFYRHCLQLLGVAAGDCLYVGDGGGKELQGALSENLWPVMVPSLVDPMEPFRCQVPDWPGERVMELREISALAGLG